MTTPFLTRDNRLFSSLEKAFGEAFIFSARAAGGDVNLPTVIDNSKPAFQCVGIWEANSEANFPMARGSNPDDEVVRRNPQYPSVLVRDSVLLTWKPKRSDYCQRLFDGALYEIANASPDGRGNTLFKLSSRMRPS